MELKDWIRAARQAAKLTQTQLGERLNLTKGNVSAWENARHQPSYAQLQQISEISGLPLPSNNGKHYLADADESSTSPNTGLIAESSQEVAPRIGDKKPSAYGNVEPVTGGSREIPVISYVQAGMMTEALDPFSLGEGFETITVDFPCSERTFALRIRGRSMLPTFEEGDVIVVDPLEQPVPGSFVVAKNTEEEATFKKYKALGVNEYGDAVFELVPLNDDFATLHSQRDHLHVIGVAVEHRKKLLKQSA